MQRWRLAYKVEKKQHRQILGKTSSAEPQYTDSSSTESRHFRQRQREQKRQRRGEQAEQRRLRPKSGGERYEQSRRRRGSNGRRASQSGGQWAREMQREQSAVRTLRGGLGRTI
ncbi:hypothetical protein U1Q18_012289 [Sarracenia purpurea var. burkii]